MLHFIRVAIWPLQLRFHLRVYIIQSSTACRWCCALLGIFSLDKLTFERLGELPAHWSIGNTCVAQCLDLCRYLAAVCK